ncbi:hypothetical protein KC19_10G151500 [Ceratodon purpureus]|uniref:Biogenesis of lysosome-related organelles complex 1 subunit 7 n=1 Tax=Ceratodon purpureus TaxID=3225 RepID=A0A8T0GKL6_CERPU|nr:hypothetical protein KC19_10G151500 [Ceratodon purpureus]
MDAGEAQRTDGSADVMAQGLASVLGPVVRDFDARVEGALKSQSLLTGSIDRLTKELDKLLEDTPIPMVAQHAAKLSGVRKRVASLMSTLRVIQGRIANMDRMLNARDASTPPLPPRASASASPSPSPPPGSSDAGSSEIQESAS